MKIILSLLVLIAPFLAHAQSSRIEDSLAVDKACKDYVEGFYTGDSNRLKAALHAELCKRVLPEKMNYKIYSSSVNDLIKAAVGRQKQADPDPSVAFKITVEIYDLSYGIATAKISTNKLPFIDYAQLAKVNTDWKIINVLWAFTKQ